MIEHPLPFNMLPCKHCGETKQELYCEEDSGSAKYGFRLGCVGECLDVYPDKDDTRTEWNNTIEEAVEEWNAMQCDPQWPVSL